MKTVLCTLVLLFSSFSWADLNFKQTIFKWEPPAGASEMVRQFEFTNDGEKPVEIIAINSKCDCTVAELDKKVYQPDESGSITATFTFGDREGEHKKTILLSTDASHAPVELDLVADIKPMLTINPRMLFWRQDEPVEPKKILVAMSNQKDFNLVRNPETLKHFDMKLVDDQDGVLTYQVMPIDPDKSIREDLMLGVQPKNHSDQSATPIGRKKVFFLIR